MTGTLALIWPAMIAAFPSLLVEAVEALTIVLAVATIRGSARALLEILPCVLVPRRARGLWSN